MLREAIAELDRAEEEPEKPPAEPLVSPERAELSESTPPAQPHGDATSRPEDRKLGLGLTIGGAALTAAGIGLLAYGGSFTALNNRLAGVYERDEADGTLSGDDLETANAFLAEERRQANTWLAVGGVAAGVGVGLMVGGLVVLYRERGSAESARVIPMLGPRTSGLAFVRRF